MSLSLRARLVTRTAHASVGRAHGQAFRNVVDQDGQHHQPGALGGGGGFAVGPAPLGGVPAGAGWQHRVLVGQETVDGEHQAHAGCQTNGREAGRARCRVGGGRQQRLPGLDGRQQQGEDGGGQHHAGSERHERGFMPLAHALHKEHRQRAHGGGHRGQQRSLHARGHGAALFSRFPPGARGRPEGGQCRQPGHEQNPGAQRQQRGAQRVRWHRQFQVLELFPHGADLADEGGHGGLLKAAIESAWILPKTIDY
jgi:hypothetical protein